ncbi:MAG: hypothetical protein K0R15_2075 [Clostridiales bacterium]|nr:hypothetical protein [Clostridiales bacterium]
MNYRKSRSFLIAYIILWLSSLCAILTYPFFLKVGNIMVNQYNFECLILSKLHIYCPGCGGTRAFSQIIEGDIVGSILSNPIPLFMIIIYIIIFIDMTRKLISPKNNKWFNYKPAFITIILLIFYTLILRNIIAILLGIDYLGDLS